jgi:hypothetical protein
MQKKYALLQGSLAALLLSAVCCGALVAQSFPQEFHFSPDGKRLIVGGEPVGGFYDEAEIHVIELWFAQSNYWQQLVNNYQSSADIAATMIVNGDTLPSPVGVHFKGMTSYFQTQNSQKKSFSISTNFVDEEQSVGGYNSLNLHNCFDDPSFMREVLYYHQIRKHIPASKANFTHLFINGQDWGLYPSVQQLDGNFFEEWFLSNDGTRWRALKPGAFGGPGGGGGDPFGAGKSSLNWLGTDTLEYQDYYTLKKANKPNPWDDLLHVCDVLNNTPPDLLEAEIRNVIDLDRTLWFLATEIAFADDDSYVHKGGMDYYLYWEPETGRMVPQEVDGNTTMKAMDLNWSPFYNEDDDRFPLLNRLLAVPEIRQRYLAHLRTIVEESFVQTDINAAIDNYFSMIDTIVQADPKKLYSYSAFVSDKNLLKNNFQQRRNNLSNNAAVNVQGLVVSDVTYAVDGTPFAAPDAGQEVVVTANISGAITVAAARLYYADGLVGNFEKTDLFDDGAHHDGAAGDGVFGAVIPGYDEGQYVRFYIEAIANNTQRTATYEPAGAEHDVFIYRVHPGAFSVSDVVINEMMASNTQTAADQDGEYDDWIELYNTSANPVDLSGWFLSDNVDNLGKYDFPDGTVIGGHGFLIVWADEDGSQSGLHANFKLSASGEQLYLVNPDTAIVQEVIFFQQQTDKGYARVPNGTGNFVIQAPTFNQPNDLTNAAEETNGDPSRLVIFPNPNSGQLTIKTTSLGNDNLLIFNGVGQLVHTAQLTGGTISLQMENLPDGMYLARTGKETGRFVVQR